MLGSGRSSAPGCLRAPEDGKQDGHWGTPRVCVCTPAGRTRVIYIYAVFSMIHEEITGDKSLRTVEPRNSRPFGALEWRDALAIASLRPPRSAVARPGLPRAWHAASGALRAPVHGSAVSKDLPCPGRILRCGHTDPPTSSWQPPRPTASPSCAASKTTTNSSNRRSPGDEQDPFINSPFLELQKRKTWLESP